MKDRLTQLWVLALALILLGDLSTLAQSRLSERTKATAGVVCGPGSFHYTELGDTGTADIIPPAHSFAITIPADSVTVIFADGSTAPAFGVGDSWSFGSTVNGQPNIAGFEVNGVAGCLSVQSIDWHSF